MVSFRDPLKGCNGDLKLKNQVGSRLESPVIYCVFPYVRTVFTIDFHHSIFHFQGLCMLFSCLACCLLAAYPP